MFFVPANSMLNAGNQAPNAMQSSMPTSQPISQTPPTLSQTPQPQHPQQPSQQTQQPSSNDLRAQLVLQQDGIGGMSPVSQLVNSNPSGTVAVPGIRPPVSHVTAISVPQQVTQSPCKCMIVNFFENYSKLS